MSDWNQTLLAPTASIDDAIRTIDRSAMQICLVADGEGHLQGTITDGDIRRAILRGLALTAPVSEIMRTEPTTASESTPRTALLDIMTERQIRQIPLLDPVGRIAGLAFIDDLLRRAATHDGWVVLMAGGLGTRLRPLTETAPKPLLKVGDKPILEIIIDNFVRQGFRRFYISVNYMAEKIKDHFGDGHRWNAEIRYLEETERLGTAGSLRLIPERPDTPLVTMNADLLTQVDFRALLAFHAERGAAATMCVRDYGHEVPFGVVEIDDEHRITDIQEKPVQSCFVNAGIYALDPQVIDLIPEGGIFDMTSLFERIIAEDLTTAAFPVFPVGEYWLDVGRKDDLDRAHGDYSRVFGKDGG